MCLAMLLSGSVLDVTTSQVDCWGWAAGIVNLQQTHDGTTNARDLI